MTASTRLTGVVAAGALLLAGTASALGAEPTSAAPPAIGPGAAPLATAVTLFLRAPHPAALARLAAIPVRDRSTRLARLAALVPTASARRSVVATLESDGLTIQHQTTWSVAATGSALTLAELFGTRPTGRPSHAVATGPLPTLPTALDRLVAAAYPTTGGPAAFHARTTTTLAGSDFRRADTAAGVAPSGGAKDTGLTIATLQLANAPASDLTHYANDHHIADPVANGHYKAVTVDGGPSAVDPSGTGTIEVDLDQESILSTAPSANQHPYFAPNTQAGFDDVFSNVYDDVAGNPMATAPDPHLVALSSSWGGCEGGTGAKNIKVLEPIMASVVAAGVTIFSSSGDDGIYDCGSTDGTGDDNSQADVDYPGSSPYVVSVGGTNLSAPTSAPNTGTNWTERTWSCKTPAGCQNSNSGTGGGGGGASGSAYGHSYAGAKSDVKGFAMPRWQRRTLTGSYAKSPTRLVPDIAADGDPNTGFTLYSSAGTGIIGTNLGVGGTSLAAPISAAQLANTLGDTGRHTGVGDIHAALYSALARTAKLPVPSRYKALRDVTVGQIGAPGDRGKDPAVTAARGYDTTSGVGGVLWSGLEPFLFDTAPPRTAGLAFLHHADRPTTKVEVGFRWATRAGKDKLVFDTTTVKIFERGSKVKLFEKVDGTTYSGYHALRLARGKTYVMTVQSTDLGGHRSALSTTTIYVPKLKHS